MARLLSTKNVALLMGMLIMTGCSLPYLVYGTVYDANAAANPSFEDQLNRWLQYTRHASPDSSITVDSSRAVDGTFSARVDMGKAANIGFIGLYQVLPFPQNTLLFNNITDRADGFDFWFYVEPKYNGTGDFEVRFLAQNAREMDYVFDPDPTLSYPNTTFSDGRVMTKNILLYGYPTGQWHHFTRNLRADWQSPVKMPSGQMLPGYGLNESLSWVEFDATEFQDYTGKTYSETLWIDNVTIHYDSTSQPLPPPPGPGPGPGPLAFAIDSTFIWGALVVILVITTILLAVLASRKQKHNESPRSSTI